MARKKTYSIVPSFNELMIPTLKALKALGGSGSIEEISERVAEIANISEKALAIPHKEDGMRSEVDYRLAWARTYLRSAGLIENSSRGIWALADNDIDPAALNANEIVKAVRAENKKTEKDSSQSDDSMETIVDHESDELDWKEKLLKVLQAIEPAAFERLSQRILRESGLGYRWQRNSAAQRIFEFSRFLSMQAVQGFRSVELHSRFPRSHAGPGGQRIVHHYRQIHTGCD